MALRSCRRCAQQKRRCDHGVPACQLCRQVGEVCDYPKATRKHGPTAGTSEMSAGRIRELEAALDFLLGIPEVRASLESTIQVRGSNYLIRRQRSEDPAYSAQRSTAPLSTLGDLLKYAEQRFSGDSPNQGQTGRLGVAPASDEGDRSNESRGSIAPIEGHLESFASVATGPRFDFSFPTTPVSFNAMLTSAGDQVNPSPSISEGVRPIQWPSDIDIQSGSQIDRANELYW